MPTYRTQLVVTGGGMAGLATALAAAGEGFDVVLVERGAATAHETARVVSQNLTQQQYDNRVSALTRASQNLLSNLGAWHLIELSRAQAYRKMFVWDGSGLGQIQFDAASFYESDLGHIVENAIIVDALYKQVARQPRIKLIAGATVSTLQLPQRSGQLVAIELSNGDQILADLLVCAEGAESPTRRLAAMPMHEWDYGHKAVVATVECELGHEETAWQCFTEQGPLAFLPLKSLDSKRCSIVWSVPPAFADDLIAFDDSEFCARLERAFEKRLGRVVAVADRAGYPLRQRHAQQYVKAGFALVADAAHTIHPLAGQGINIGYLDVAQLIETLTDARSRNESIGDLAVLRRYQRARRGENLKMTASMEGFKRLFSPQPAWLQLARNIGLSAVDRSGPLKQHLVSKALGLSGPLPRLSRDFSSHRTP